jgi:hypothetical protein
MWGRRWDKSTMSEVVVGHIRTRQARRRGESAESDCERFKVSGAKKMEGRRKGLRNTGEGGWVEWIR